MYLEIGFNPTETGPATGILHIITMEGDPLLVPLSGSGLPAVEPGMLQMPDAYDFGEVPIESSLYHDFRVTLTAAWSATHTAGTVNSAQITNSDAFSIVSVTSSATTLLLSRLFCFPQIH